MLLGFTTRKESLEDGLYLVQNPQISVSKEGSGGKGQRMYKEAPLQAHILFLALAEQTEETGGGGVHS